MRLAEYILLKLSRAPEAADFEQVGYLGGDPLSLLRSAFPGLHAMFQGRSVVDFGCGEGQQVVALAAAGASHVVGVDVQEGLLEAGRGLARTAGLQDRVSFHRSLPRDLQGTFDLAISQNSMEHFSQPLAMLQEISDALRHGGEFLVTFCPAWYSPYGAHMHFFTRVPWVHLLFSEQTVMTVRRRFRTDGASRYEDVEGGLNRMSLRKFERLIAESDMRVHQLTYVPVKGMPLVTHVPILRELMVNRVNCIVQKP